MGCERRFTWLPWPKSPSRLSTTTTTAVSHRSPPSSPPRNPLQNHSLSFKDVESLLNPPPPALRPQLKHSLSSPPRPSFSLKDLHTLLSSSKPSIFHRVRSWAQTQTQTQTQPPDAQNRVVIYYTSLRVVRRTFEDCRAARSILKGYRVKMDERDLSMDPTFVDELQGIIGKLLSGGESMKMSSSLPMVFVHGKYVGGVEEIRRLHESGELKRLIRGLPAAEVGVCGVCGGHRFLVCQSCDGSHRVFVEKIGLKVCSTCNENGMIKCPTCTSVVF